MIDIKLLRENIEIVKDSQRKRGEDLKILDNVLHLDKQWREIAKKGDDLKQKRNQVSLEINEAKKKGETASKQIKEMQKVAGYIKDLDEKIETKRQERDGLLCTIPNILHESVPKGKDDTENKKLREWGKKPKFTFEPKDHIDLGMDLNLFDIERAAKTSGARFYFLKNEAVILEMALARYAIDFLQKQGYSATMPPHLVREQVMYGVGMLPMSKDEIFKVENEDLYMILTSEHALAGLHMNEVLEEHQLPMKYAGFSPCYRTEAGSHGRDTKGIFRVHQFNKVEMFSFTKPEDSWAEHEQMLKDAEKLVQGLELPYEVKNICTGDIGVVAAKKYDIEVWLPGQNAYRELISASNCTDYQARRLNAKFRRGPNDKPIPMHTLNSTALALGRTIVAILENHQQKDGSIKIPKALQPYTGFKKIEK